MLRLFNLFASILLITASCTVALPEFQTAESLEEGTQRFATGPFTGHGLNASTGVSLMHSYGLSDQWDINSHVGIARLRIEQPNLKYSILVGPKWSSPNQQWAISAPIGGVYLDYLDATDEGISWTTTPTVYFSFPKGPSKIKHTLFVRSEVSYNYFYGDWFWAVGGYVLKLPIHNRDVYFSVSGTDGGVYGGIGVSLSK